MRVLVSVCVCLLCTSVAWAESFSGVVLDADGRPCDGAAITAAAIFREPPLRLTAKTDEQGRFQVDLPKVSGATRYALAVRWHDQGADLTEAHGANGKQVGIKGQPLPLQIVRLRIDGRLRGKLLRAEDDGPIADARLFMDTGEVLDTDQQGRFEVSGLAMKDHSLIPVARGRVRQYVLFDTTLRPDAELELRLPKGAIIKGRIIDEKGQPIAGAYLTRSSSGTALTLNGWDERCKPDGTFEYGGLSSERLFYSLTVRARGFKEQSISSEVRGPTDVIEQTVRLSGQAPKAAPAKTAKAAVVEKAAPPATTALPRRTISGVVRDDSGRPVEGAVVRWGTFQWDGSVKSTKSNAAGQFSLADAPAAAGAILVMAKEFTPEFAAVEAKQDKAEVKLSKGQTVRGKVVSSARSPVRGVRIIPTVTCCETGICNPIWLDDRAVETNERGEFALNAMPAGATFDILKKGYSDLRSQTLRPGDAPNEIELRTGGAIPGQVVDDAGNPVRNFKIRVMIPRKRTTEESVGGYYAGFDWYGVTFTRNDGVFVLTDIPAGGWMRMIVSAPDKGVALIDRVQTEPLDRLSPAGNLRIALKPFRPLRVRVADKSSQQPIRDVQVSVLEDELRSTAAFNWGYDDLWAQRARTDKDGIAEFLKPACDDGTLLVRVPGYARQRLEFTIGAATPTVLLERAAGLGGEVRLNGKLLADGYVRLKSPADDYMSVDLSDSGGQFKFEELTAGEYELSVSNERGQSLRQQKITLDAAQTRFETITVGPAAEAK